MNELIRDRLAHHDRELRKLRREARADHESILPYHTGPSAFGVSAPEDSHATDPASIFGPEESDSIHTPTVCIR